MTLYHATKAKHIEGIKENGLVARPTSATSSETQHDSKAVWLFEDPEDAADFAELNCFDEYVVLAVDAEGLDLYEDPEYTDDEWTTSWINEDDIVFSRISIEREVTL